MVLGLVIFATVSACRSGVLRPRELTNLPSAESAFARVRARNALRVSLRTRGRVTYFGARGRIRLRAVVLAQRPGAFRVETLSPFEQPLEVMASDGRVVWLLTEGRLLTGPATPEHIARLLPLALRPEAVVDILLGGVPTSADVRATDIVWDDDLWKLNLEDGAGEQGELWVDPTLGVTTRWVMYSRAGTGALAERVRVDFSGFGETAGAAGPFPRRIRVVLASPEADVSIKLDTPEIGVPLDARLFRIDPPPGVASEPL